MKMVTLFLVLAMLVIKSSVVYKKTNVVIKNACLITGIFLWARMMKKAVVVLFIVVVLVGIGTYIAYSKLQQHDQKRTIHTAVN